jgi:hypothetical protein
MANQVKIDPNDERQVMSALREWAYGHPAKDRPMLAYMGQSLTPLEYYEKVEKDGDFRSKLFELLVAQAHRTGERPQELVIRAIKANRA